MVFQNIADIEALHVGCAFVDVAQDQNIFTRRGALEAPRPDERLNRGHASGQRDGG